MAFAMNNTTLWFEMHEGWKRRGYLRTTLLKCPTFMSQRIPCVQRLKAIDEPRSPVAWASTTHCLHVCMTRSLERHCAQVTDLSVPQVLLYNMDCNKISEPWKFPSWNLHHVYSKIFLLDISYSFCDRFVLRPEFRKKWIQFQFLAEIINTILTLIDELYFTMK